MQFYKQQWPHIINSWETTASVHTTLMCRDVVLKIFVSCQSTGRVAKMNGTSCVSIAMVEWVNLNVINHTLVFCTIIKTHGSES